MYILIDRERMVLLHKHPSPEVLADLAWIECQNTSYYLFSIDDAFGFKEFTDMELKLLYSQIARVDISTVAFKNRSVLLQIIRDLTCRVAITTVRPFEVSSQAASIEQGASGNWIYVYGSMKPGQKPDLFAPECKCAARSETEEADALAGKLPALVAAVPQITAPLRKKAPVPNTNTAPPKAAAPSGAVREGSVTAIIRGLCDEFLENAPDGFELGTKHFRSALMSRIVDKGFNKNTVNRQVREWEKLKISS